MVDNILENKKILILVTGSIAIYKTLDLISKLKKLNAKTAVVMSDEAISFITPLTFESLSNKEVLHKNSQKYDTQDSPNHINYASWADIAILAPASINSIAKLNYAISDSIVITTLLACKCKVLIAPSANINMMESKQNKQNLESLIKMGYKILPPRESLLACNVVAKGAMADIDEIIFNIKKEFKTDNFWEDKKIVITGGGSIEQIDTIRHISNNSSGIQASALALAFYYLGAKVNLISSRFPFILPLDIEITKVNSSNDYKNALQDTKDCIVIMAAAISDYKVENPKNEKIKKSDIGKIWNLELVQNQDLLSQIQCKFKVGFKAESHKTNGEINAKKMLDSTTEGGKDCDMVILNIIDNDNKIGDTHNEITILSKDYKKKLDKQDKLTLSFEIAASIKEKLQKYDK
ncbi:bifunctional phosphopantothenoylcysteine decarboxylase/phosphopantothenate--cysteine ligase CoaBC [Helicobacter sp. MIT 99-5507]|uniref:bifunctional phosphopantothenoylcysteine decarboxylase/phosphopantothenate--cysteine ligase CoaBC n=1 Tax=Helicobacter sp. MIT 99-5507 TaxID=152489 RepID=UPI002161DD34|nr:bifunctional phosphopantothenoylcysteine decarboxylase/phosphopantothenate--cysteine ligase CoaBC [Helicobacter sp. MIT 99-5507]